MKKIMLKTTKYFVKGFLKKIAKKIYIIFIIDNSGRV